MFGKLSDIKVGAEDPIRAISKLSSEGADETLTEGRWRGLYAERSRLSTDSVMHGEEEIANSLSHFILIVFQF